MELDEKKIGASVSRRIVELEIKPVKGNFDANHLKEIHRRIFQDLPKMGGDISPGQFRPSVGNNLDWVKTRQLESVNAISNVAYSNMSSDAQKKLDKILSTIDTKKMSNLDKNEFSKTIADLYVAIDYIHPFRDGNSRTLRTFTKQIAKESGFSLNWEELNKNPAGRDILYIARDISVNKIALTQANSEGTKRDILFTLDQLGNNRDMRSLMRDIVQPIKEQTKIKTQIADKNVPER